MIDPVVCVDTGIVIKFLVVEEPVHLSDAATDLMEQIVANGRIVMPSFAWAEAGSVLRKKVRQNLLDREQAETLWEGFCQLPIEFIDTAHLRERAWEIAALYEFPTIYDAAFLACAETASEAESPATFWTADAVLVRTLGQNPPGYVRLLGVDPV